jgi:hypothetical protein
MVIINAGMSNGSDGVKNIKRRKNKMDIYVAKALASIAVCFAGAYCMKITKGQTGIGWAVLGLLFIW